jgi:exosortase
MLFKPLNSDRLTGWHLMLAAVLCAIGVYVCREAWTEIFVEYARRDEEHSHIFIVPFVAAWMVWVRRMRFRHCRPSGTILGPAIVLAGWWLSWYGFHRQTTSFFHGGAVLVFIGCAIAALGKNVLFRFFPAILVLMFLVPVPGQIRQDIANPLQTWTAQVSQAILDVIGVETELSGNTLIINGQAVMIEEACNGMRMVFPLLLIGYAFSFALPLRQSVRLLIILFSPVVAIACNVARTVPTIWLAGNAKRIAPDNSEMLFRQFHDASGWIMLPVAFLLLLMLIRLLKWAMVPVQRYTLASQ